MASTMMNEASSSSTKTPKESVVVDCGKRRSSCGYCRSTRHNSISHGMLAESLTVDDYQALLDQGWRRSGCFLYKPEMEKTCCPSYTIRLKAGDFVPSKEQLRVSRRMQRFLDGTLDVKRVDATGEPNTSKNSGSLVHNNPSCFMSEESLSVGNKEVDEVDKSLQYLSDQIDNVVQMFTENGEFPSGIQLPKASVRMVSQGKKKLLTNGSEDLLYSSNIAFQVAASINRAQSRDKDGNDSKPSRDSEKENGSYPKIIAEKLVASLDSTVKLSGLSTRACNGHINFYTYSKQVSQNGTVQNAAIPKKSGMKLDKGGNCSNSPQHCQFKKRKLEIRLNRSSFDPKEYALYRKYQSKVHNDKPQNYTESSYRRFLVDTPLLYVSHTGDSTVPPCGFGSFHQQYLVDGQLVAVGVIDILPNCLSSKYLFWDPDFAFLSLGKYSALQEIGWVKDNQVYCPSLQYYYLGYYIHSCNKMRYKAAYRPSELLCPLRYQWVSFDIARPLLDRKRYVVLSDASILPNGESSPLQVTEVQDSMLIQLDDNGQEDANDVPMHEDEEMVEFESESSDDEPDLQTNCEPENCDFSKVLLEIKGSRLRYKNLRSVLGPEQQRYLESQLQKYRRVVGAVLSERMVYSLG
ncbi:arginyl-tRNA--protein transferase 2-like [Vicia villosa]|uniref:arginyl-tRNA--protein transferase 2-like n=1 Tax=Vicia villosa TaxID=3911 RepID=UPI00273CD7EF|nr:arginyl-tRNA--protein transferase 2-like [Vicia villosa]